MAPEDMDDQQFREHIMGRVTHLEATQVTLRDAIDANTVLTKKIDTSTSSMVEVLAAAAGAFKVLNWIARAAKPLGIIAAAVGAAIGAWHTWKSGGFPLPPSK